MGKETASGGIFGIENRWPRHISGVFTITFLIGGGSSVSKKVYLPHKTIQIKHCPSGKHFLNAHKNRGDRCGLENNALQSCKVRVGEE